MSLATISVIVIATCVTFFFSRSDAVSKNFTYLLVALFFENTRLKKIVVYFKLDPKQQQQQQQKNPSKFPNVLILVVLQVKKIIRRTDWPVCHEIRANLWKELCNTKDWSGSKRLYSDEAIEYDRINQGIVKLFSLLILYFTHNLRQNLKLE